MAKKPFTGSFLTNDLLGLVATSPNDAAQKLSLRFSTANGSARLTVNDDGAEQESPDRFTTFNLGYQFYGTVVILVDKLLADKVPGSSVVFDIKKAVYVDDLRTLTPAGSLKFYLNENLGAGVSLALANGREIDFPITTDLVGATINGSSIDESAMSRILLRVLINSLVTRNDMAAVLQAEHREQSKRARKAAKEGGGSDATYVARTELAPPDPTDVKGFFY